MISNRRTHDLIPGGAHTYSKGDDQFPSNAPSYLERGEGSHVFDDAGTRYLDWTMGLRTMTLGYGRREVDEAAIEQLKRGNNFGRPSLIETDLAQAIVDVIPCADMVKFAKNGSTVTTAAIKLARAFTDRPMVAFCKDHPFFSYDDWFIGTTVCDGGVPQLNSSLSLPFSYNDIAGLRQLFETYPDQIAAVILEPCIAEPPRDNFLQQVRDLCTRYGAVMILDEMISGFRWDLGGAANYFGVVPDMATFGKGIANGYSVSALAGRREIMELGGLRHDKKRVFLISTTHGAENVSLAAAKAALQIYRTEPVIEHLWKIGQSLIDGVNTLAREAGIDGQIGFYGYGCRPEFFCKDKDGQASLPLRTLFLQEMITNGVLMSYVVPSYAHTMGDVDKTLAAARAAIATYARALDGGWQQYLIGDPIKPVFRPFN